MAVNLLTGTASDGFGGTDTLISIEDVRGSTFGDTIVGNAANNKLTGDAGNDTLTGGSGVDTFALATSSTDTVTDFATGPGGDLLDLSSVIAQFTNYTGGSNPFTSGHLRLTQSGADTLVQADIDGVGGGTFESDWA